MKHRTCFFLFLTAICMKLFVVPVALFAQGTYIGETDDIRWVQSSDRIGYGIDKFAQKGDTIFAVHNGFGIIYSTDAGEQWHRTSMTFGAQVLALSSIGLVTVGDKFPYVSADAGVSWQKVRIDTSLSSYSGIALSMNNNYGSILCLYDTAYRFRDVSEARRLFVTNDGGLTWKKQEKSSQEYNTITYLGDILFCGGKKGQQFSNIAYSTNQGKSWTNATSLPENIIRLQGHKSMLFAFTDGNMNRNPALAVNLFVSLDSGKSWQQCKQPQEQPFLFPYPPPEEQQRGNSEFPLTLLDDGGREFTDIHVEKDGNILASLSSNLLYRSKDTGRTWQIVNSYLWKSRVPMLRTILTTDTSIFLGGRGIYRCLPNGERFESALAGYLQDNFWFGSCYKNINFVTTTGVKRKIYFLSSTSGLYRSFDGWLWQSLFPKLYRWRATDPIDPLEFFHPIYRRAYFSSMDDDYCISALAGNDSTILAFTRSGSVLRSLDKGTTWQTIARDLRFASDTAMLVEHKSTFVAVVGRNGYRSSDNGVTWQSIPEINRNAISSDIHTLTANSSSLFLSTNNKILISSNDGHSWVDIVSPQQSAFIQNIAVTDSVLYAVTNKGLFRSVSGGKEWEEPNEDLFGVHPDIKNILTFGNYGAITAIRNSFIFTTFNNGKNWQPNRNSYATFFLPFPGVYETIHTSASNNLSLLAVTQENHLFRADMPIHIKIPDRIRLFNNVGQALFTVAPNPVSDITNIAWFQRNDESVSLGIYDTYGKMLSGFTNRFYPSGIHRHTWDVQNFASGVYFYRGMIGSRSYSGTIIVSK